MLCSAVLMAYLLGTGLVLFGHVFVQCFFCSTAISTISTVICLFSCLLVFPCHALLTLLTPPTRFLSPPHPLTCSLSFPPTHSLPLIHSLTHSLTHSPTHPHSLPLPHPLAHPLTLSLACSLTHSLSHWLTGSLYRLLFHPLTHSLTHSHSLTLSLTHSLSPSLAHSLTH